MARQYREVLRLCPACGAVMREHEAAEATIDLCSHCAGIFVEWFDGDARVAVRGASPPAATPVTEPGTGACPACRSPLTRERYRGDGPEVLRCGDCAGTFVGRDVFEILVALRPRHEPERGPLEQMLERLKEWLWTDGETS